MKGLVLAPHSSLILWNDLNIAMKYYNRDHKLDGFTYVKYDSISYNKIYYIKEEELSINTIENNISNINCIISRDRWLRNLDYKKSLKICNNIYNILDKVFKENKYNFLIGEVSCATNEIAFYLSKIHNIPFYNITASLYINKYFIYIANDIYGNNNFIKKKLLNFKFSDEIYKNESEIISRLKSKSSINFPKTKIYFKNLIYNLFYFKKSIFNDHHNKLLINLLALSRILFKSDQCYYQKIKSVKDLNYFLYFLHYEPDLSTFTWANNYLDQLHLIKIISNNLPFGTSLLIKEHPLSKNIRPGNFYKNIIKLPNVKLISSQYFTYDLISNSKGVITITGSVGYEAWLLGKPVMVFGNVFYDSFEGVFITKNFDLIYDTLIKFLEYKISNEELKLRNNIDFFISNNCTKEGTVFSYENNFSTISTGEKIKNMQNIYNYIIKTLNEK